MHSYSEPFSRPIAINALCSVDDDGSLAERGTGAKGIKGDQCIAESLGFGGPVRGCTCEGARGTYQLLKLRKHLDDSTDVAASSNSHGKHDRCDDAVLTVDGELQGRGSCAQHDVLAAKRVEKDVRNVGEVRDEQPWTAEHVAANVFNIEAQTGCTDRWDPDRICPISPQSGVNESRRAPKPLRRHGERACGSTAGPYGDGDGPGPSGGVAGRTIGNPNCGEGTPMPSRTWLRNASIRRLGATPAMLDRRSG
jgi:hypothetical protein